MRKVNECEELSAADLRGDTRIRTNRQDQCQLLFSSFQIRLESAKIRGQIISLRAVQ